MTFISTTVSIHPTSLNPADKKHSTKIKSSTYCLAALLSSSLNLVYAKESDWTAQFAIGTTHNSHMAITEIDEYAEEAEAAFSFNVNLEGELIVNDSFSLKSGYKLSSNTYEKNTAFDLRIQQANLGFEYDFAGIEVGGDAYFVQAKLAQQNFMDYQQQSFHLSKLFSDSIYLRLSHIDQQKSFDNEVNRNGRSKGIGFDSYFFFNQAKSHFFLRTRFEKERTKTQTFDNDVTTLDLGMTHEATVFDHKNAFSLGWKITEKDFLSEQSSPNEENNNELDELTSNRGQAITRNDSSGSATFTWDVTLNDSIKTLFSIEKGVFDSNLTEHQYKQTVTSFHLSVQF